MPVYQIDGLTPVVPDESYVHPTAVLIGDVILGKGVYVGPNASLRGDFGRIVVKDGANIQDNCVMHGFPEQDTVVEEDGHIGHSAILHGCIIRRNALVGMNAVVMDGAVIGEERNPLLVRQPVRVFRGVNQLEKVDTVDEPDLEFGEMLEEEIYSRCRLMCADVAARCHD